ncbi:PilZ domain-containing protein [Shewanella sp. OMA3-2]|uniref:PilZ domain-containing protein n=1 Tax=Shewanella sp. OMA3-2 TaxID=2908650 RepID=UPI001F31EAEE|nr:PilZ domain-containing protein [Shewanella sp. OMA3-2]UJF22800.1 flagellar brake protein [Shewanella sp. OMA3-2]
MATKQVSTNNNHTNAFKFLLAGTSVNIDIVTPTGELGRFRTTFIGYLPQQFILIQSPDSTKLGKHEQYIVKNAPITVRGLVEGHEASVIAFQTTLRQTLSTPSKMLVLDFPDTMMIHNLRSTKRVLTALACSVIVNGKEYEAVMTDVSLSGCHISLAMGGADSITEDIIISVKFCEHDDEEATLTVSCKVCNLKPFKQGVEFGVEFEAEQSASIESIIRLALLSEK